MGASQQGPHSYEDSPPPHEAVERETLGPSEEFAAVASLHSEPAVQTPSSRHPRVSTSRCGGAGVRGWERERERKRSKTLEPLTDAQAEEIALRHAAEAAHEAALGPVEAEETAAAGAEHFALIDVEIRLEIRVVVLGHGGEGEEGGLNLFSYADGERASRQNFHVSVGKSICS